MAPRKAPATNPIDPVKVCILALKQVTCVADYNRIDTANTPETLTAAWNLLAAPEQQHITDIINNNAQPDPQVLADELIACGTALELKHVKSEYGDLVKQAWKLLPKLSAIASSNCALSLNQNHNPKQNRNHNPILNQRQNSNPNLRP